MVTTGAVKNGQAGAGRPSLSNQIDRLDGILDGLAEALNESVADAVRGTVGDVVRETVREVLGEVLASPALLAQVQARNGGITSAPQAASVVEAKPRTLSDALGDVVGWLCAAAAVPLEPVGKGLSWAWSWCAARVWDALSALSACWNAAKCLAAYAWGDRSAGLAALGVGAGVGLAAWAAGPVAASLLCGVAGAAMTLGGWMLSPFWKAVADQG
jgi:hypothetical protein